MSGITSDYWRSRDGSIVHTKDCMYSSGSKGGHPWPYADGKARWQIEMYVEDVPWLSLCKRCFIEEKNDDS